MQQVETIRALHDQLAVLRRDGRRVAFVPTMGNLHAGHLQLVKTAAKLAEVVVASIFVNPMQFGPTEDFGRYPRTEQEDAGKLCETGCDLLFLPAVETLFPLPLAEQTRVEVPGLSNELCGASRPGHFVGVATVVNKLFNLVQPDVAVFGEKDYQQLLVIRRMVSELCMPLEIVGVATVREADGLAMSSRNQYLDAEQRQTAPLLYQQLQQMAEAIHAGETDFDGLQQKATKQLEQAGFRTDYLRIARRDNLQPAVASDVVSGDAGLVILAAALLGTTRLIDNLQVEV